MLELSDVSESYECRVSRRAEVGVFIFALRFGLITNFPGLFLVRGQPRRLDPKDSSAETT